MRVGEELITYATGLIALTLIVRNGPEISGILKQISASTAMFSGVLLGGR